MGFRSILQNAYFLFQTFQKFGEITVYSFQRFRYNSCESKYFFKYLK